VRDPGTGPGELADLVVVDVYGVGEPDVVAEPSMVSIQATGRCLKRVSVKSSSSKVSHRWVCRRTP
jgi:hypothetical protein